MVAQLRVVSVGGLTECVRRFEILLCGHVLELDVSKHYCAELFEAKYVVEALVGHLLIWLRQTTF